MSTAIFGVVAPHPPIMVHAVGGSRAETTRASLDALAEASSALAAFDPQTLVVVSPHAPLVPDAFAVDDSQSFAGSLADFGDTTSFAWSGDPALAHSLASELERQGIPVILRSASARLKAGWLDHATIVPLSFLEPTQRRSIVVISLSYLSYAAHRALGAAIRSSADSTGRRIAFIASGDLSHRLTPDAPAGYSPRAADLDAAIVAHVKSGDFSALMDIDEPLIEAGGECGLRSFIALGGYAGADPVPTRVLAYEGPWGVGYLTALVGKAALDACDTRHFESTPERGAKGGSAGADESEIVRLARAVIEAHIGSGSEPRTPTLDDPSYPQRAGAFVSLHRNGVLRGCIGTILPVHPTLAEEVAANALQAATRDPRFPPLSADELADLEISVDVLAAPESCTLDDLDPEHYGVIASSGWRRGLLLPDLDGVDDVESQVRIATQKAGIRPGEPCSYERFKVDRYT